MDLPEMPRLSKAYKLEGDTGTKIRSFGEVLRNRLDTHGALQTLNGAVQGEEVTKTQLEAARIILNKCLPDLKAVAVRINENTPVSKADIDSMLLSAGLKPEQEWNTIEGKAEPVEAKPIEAEAAEASGESE